jgi:hypothetical protein
MIAFDASPLTASPCQVRPRLGRPCAPRCSPPKKFISAAIRRRIRAKKNSVAAASESTRRRRPAPLRRSLRFAGSLDSLTPYDGTRGGILRLPLNSRTSAGAQSMEVPKLLEALPNATGQTSECAVRATSGAAAVAAPCSKPHNS